MPFIDASFSPALKRQCRQNGAGQGFQDHGSCNQEKPAVGDRAYDGDFLDKRLKRKGIELIAPHKTEETGWKKFKALQASLDGGALFLLPAELSKMCHPLRTIQSKLSSFYLPGCCNHVLTLFLR